MNVSATSSRPKFLKNIGRIFTMVSTSPKADVGFDEDLLSFSTTDGSMVAYKSGENAVSAGAGIFIGGYFVGVADEDAHTDTNKPLIKY